MRRTVTLLARWVAHNGAATFVEGNMPKRTLIPAVAVSIRTSAAYLVDVKQFKYQGWWVSDMDPVMPQGWTSGSMQANKERLLFKSSWTLRLLREL